MVKSKELNQFACSQFQTIHVYLFSAPTKEYLLTHYVYQSYIGLRYSLVYNICRYVFVTPFLIIIFSWSLNNQDAYLVVFSMDSDLVYCFYYLEFAPILPIEILCFSISVKQLYIVNNNSIFILMNYHSEIIPIENIKVIKS